MKPIPYYVDPPALSPAQIEEISGIIFGEPIDPQPCDLIFIFGGSHPGLWESGAQAYHQGLGVDIVATGGYKASALRHADWVDGSTPESDVIRRELIRLGVPEAHIFAEKRSTNSYENVCFALEVYDFAQVTSILVVCKSHAVGRQIRTLQAQLHPGVKVIPYPFDTHLGGGGPWIDRDNWMDYPEGRAYLFANLLKIVQYGRAGHLLPVEGISPGLMAIVQNHLES